MVKIHDVQDLTSFSNRVEPSIQVPPHQLFPDLIRKVPIPFGPNSNAIPAHTKMDIDVKPDGDILGRSMSHQDESVRPTRHSSNSSGLNQNIRSPTAAPHVSGFSLNDRYVGSYAFRQEETANQHFDPQLTLGSLSDSSKYTCDRLGLSERRNMDMQDDSLGRLNRLPAPTILAQQRPDTLCHSNSLPITLVQATSSRQDRSGRIPQYFQQTNFTFTPTSADSFGYSHSVHPFARPQININQAASSLHSQRSLSTTTIHHNQPKSRYQCLTPTSEQNTSRRSQSYNLDRIALMRHGLRWAESSLSSEYPNNNSASSRSSLMNERPHRCDECLQSFNRNHDLKRHKRIHLAVKPFACDQCDKQFSRKDALRRHWLVKGCKSSDDTSANMLNPAYDAGVPALSPYTPGLELPGPLGCGALLDDKDLVSSPKGIVSQYQNPERANNFTTGPCIVTPDDTTFGDRVYITHEAQAISAAIQSHILKDNYEDPAPTEAGGSDFQIAEHLDNFPLSSIYGCPLEVTNSNPSTSYIGICTLERETPRSTTFMDIRLPGRYSLDARSYSDFQPDRQISLAPRAASISLVPNSQLARATKRTSVTIQPMGRLQDCTSGGQRDYFEGVFDIKFPPPMIDGVGASSPLWEDGVGLSERPPIFMMPFGPRRTQLPQASLQLHQPLGQQAEAWSRWHRPSFPFPATESVNPSQSPKKMDKAEDLRKSISRAGLSYQSLDEVVPVKSSSSHSGGGVGQRWSRSSFPFPDNASNAFGVTQVKVEDTVDV